MGQLRAKENQGLFQAVFERAAIGIGIVNKEGRIVRINPALERMLGYGEDEMCRKRFADVTHPDDVDKDTELFRQVIRRERDHYQIEKRYISRDGSIIWVRLTVSIAHRGAGDPEFLVIGMMEDITERKREDELLKRAHDQLQTLIRRQAARLGETEGALKAEVAQRRQAEELVRAIRDMLGGGHRTAALPEGPAPPEGDLLTRREREVLRLIAEGFGNKEIASRLNVSVKTIDTHRERLMKKLKLQSRAEIVRYALNRGWMQGG